MEVDLFREVEALYLYVIMDYMVVRQLLDWLNLQELELLVCGENMPLIRVYSVQIGVLLLVSVSRFSDSHKGV